MGEKNATSASHRRLIGQHARDRIRPRSPKEYVYCDYLLVLRDSGVPWTWNMRQSRWGCRGVTTKQHYLLNTSYTTYMTSYKYSRKIKGLNLIFPPEPKLLLFTELEISFESVSQLALLSQGLAQACLNSPQSCCPCLNLLSAAYCWSPIVCHGHVFGISGSPQDAHLLASSQHWNTYRDIPCEFSMGWLSMGLPLNVGFDSDSESSVLARGQILLLISQDVSGLLSCVGGVIGLHQKSIVVRIKSLLKCYRWPLFLEDWMCLNGLCM